MSHSGERTSWLRLKLRVTGAAFAAPLRLADAVLGLPHSSNPSPLVRELERLAEMRDAGDLSPEEYRLAKERLLGGSAR